MSIELMTPHEVLLRIARKAKEKRLSLNLTQATLSKRSGVSYGVLKKFERTGQIALESLLKLALVLEGLEGFKDVFPILKPEEATSLDELIREKKRQRGRE